MLGDTYLTVHQWYKGFTPWKSHTIVWVQLLELPVEFFNPEAVRRIAEKIGRPIRVDKPTELGARVKYARVCVEVDLTRPLLSQFKIEGITYLIQYEGMYKICSECGIYGATTAECRCQLSRETSATTNAGRVGSYGGGPRNTTGGSNGGENVWRLDDCEA
ncbi:unnamed protein product [Linum tenue]|uniref:DUF4283 domain-containing protein n=1 Tax=Linum tenue TaxID=586396 RepID=A0AAV0QMI2_9ROSI|nr:unnamed protein product [Linum tenue]